MMFSETKKTRFPELSYQMQGRNNWRIIDNSTQSAIGPYYPTERSLLADIERFASQFGC